MAEEEMQISGSNDMRVSGSSAGMRASAGSVDLRLSDGTIDQLFRTSDDIATLPVGKEEDWMVMRLSGDVEQQLVLEQQQQQQQQQQQLGALSPSTHCTFAHHHSAVAGRKGSVRVQERPFSRVGWVELARNIPICERCTSTLRKHWCGQTTSLALCREFLGYIGRVQCRGCHQWVGSEVVQRLGDMICGCCEAAPAGIGAGASASSSVGVAPVQTRSEPVADMGRIGAIQSEDGLQVATSAPPSTGSSVHEHRSYTEYTPTGPPVQYVFLYGDAAGYRQALAQHVPSADGDGRFPCWTACVGDCPGHVYALTSVQMMQLDRIFVGDAVRTSVTALLYTLDGSAEQIAATTYCTAEDLSAR